MRIAFAGTPEFAIPFLEALLQTSQHEIIAIYTQPDRPAGRRLRLTSTPIKQYCLDNLSHKNIPIIQPNKFSDDGILEQLQRFNPDIFIDVACGLFIPKSVLNLPKFGCVNVHPSLLPRWRGASPIQRAILAGDDVTGITIMKMDSGLDTGPIFQQSIIHITDDDTTNTLMKKLVMQGVTLLLDTIDKLATNSIYAKPQNNEQQIYAEKITKEEAKIDWNKSAIEIYRMIRAYNPFPIAYTNIEQNVCKIYEARIISNHEQNQENINNNDMQNVCNGTIIASNKHGIDVKTSMGILRVLQLQLPNKKVLHISELLNSPNNANMFQVGKRFT